MRTRSLARSRDREVAKSRKENARVSPSSQPKKNAVHRSVKQRDRGGEVKEKKNEWCLSEERERVHANANPATEGCIIGKLKESQRQNVSRQRERRLIVVHDVRRRITVVRG